MPDALTLSASARRLADSVATLGYAPVDAVAQALTAAPGRRPLDALADAALLDEEQLAHAAAVAADLEYADLEQTRIDPGAASLISITAAHQYRAVPIGRNADGRLRVAVTDPANTLALAEIAQASHLPTVPVVVSRTGLERALERLADPLLEPPEPEPSAPAAVADDAPVVRLVNSLITDALEQRASDIHFDFEGGEIHVKQRIDGLLVRSTTIAAEFAPSVISRLKILADLDIAERRVPQDGRIRARMDGREADLRVVTVPVVGGESAVLRVLDTAGGPMSLDDLGMSGSTRQRFEAALAHSWGAVFVTGPTGSGKTTTLYGALQLLNGGERSIVTVEDPVEYEVSNAKQMQLHARAGLTFANALRTLMRADPDIVMVGEVRDAETARIAIEAALTGHLVLSTLHTNDAASATVRLTEMGIEPYLLASAVRCVVAQRLVRRLCDACRLPVVLTHDVLRGCGLDATEEIEAWEAAGCPRCAGTGYRGRLGVYEVLDVDAAIRELVLAGADAASIGRAAGEAGMVRLREDALEKLVNGATSLAEVTRVLGRSD